MQPAVGSLLPEKILLQEQVIELRTDEQGIAVAGDMKDLKVGDKVPSFTLKNYDGKEVDLKKVLKENKYTVIMFISTSDISERR